MFAVIGGGEGDGGVLGSDGVVGGGLTRSGGRGAGTMEYG